MVVCGGVGVVEWWHDNERKDMVVPVVLVWR